MPLISSVPIEGGNSQPYDDFVVAESALLSITRAAGGDIDNTVDFRTQTLPVLRNATVPTPIGEGQAQPSVDPTIAVPQYDVKHWPQWLPITKQMDANTDPDRLSDRLVRSMAATFPLGFDEYYLPFITAGANVVEVLYDPAAANASMKGLLTDFVSSTHSATGAIFTRLGELELGWTEDGDGRRMDMREALGIPTASTRITTALRNLANDATVLAIVGPFNAGVVGINQMLDITRHPDATVNAYGPGNGYVNWQGESAMGYGNYIASLADKTLTGDGFTILKKAD